MSNNFLDNYKKKSEEDFAQISEKVNEQAQYAAPNLQNAADAGESAPQQNNSGAQIPQQNNSSQGIASGKSQTGAQSGNVQNPQQTTQSVQKAQASMNYEQSSGFKAPPRKNKGAQRPGKYKLPINYIIIGVVCLVAIIIALMLFNGGTSLPAMVGWSETDANLWARENEALLQIEEVYSDEIAAGQIISQSPQEGESVENGEFVKLVISKGPDLSIMVPVPDIMNMTMQEVEAWANENHMTKVRITTEESQTIPLGQAIRFYVNDNTVLGSEIQRDTPFYVIFSKGQGEGEEVKLPNFLTMSVDEAKAFATENKIVLNIIEEFSETIPEGQVISQNIKAEETVRAGDTVILNVSLGEEIIVPDFYKLSRKEAEIKAQQLGITTIITEKYTLGYDKDKLVSQSIRSGTLYDDEDIIELVYSLGFKIVIQSFVGKTEVDVREWITPFNEEGASLKVNTTYTSSSEPAGTILSQDKIDYTLTITDTINFVVSKGGIVYVPNFVSPQGTPFENIITREKAIDICTQLQLVPVFIEEASAGRMSGEVYWQSIQAGSEVKPGDTITLKYNPVATMYTVPDFTGLTEAEIIGSIYNSQFTISFDNSEYSAGNIGKAFSQSVAVGSNVPANTNITVKIGNNTPPATP